jgi:hypothetical protein
MPGTRSLPSRSSAGWAIWRTWRATASRRSRGPSPGVRRHPAGGDPRLGADGQLPHTRSTFPALAPADRVAASVASKSGTTPAGSCWTVRASRALRSVRGRSIPSSLHCGADEGMWHWFSATFSDSLAGVAQSAERLHGKEEVRGSIPRSSSRTMLQVRSTFLASSDSGERDESGRK